MVPGYVDSILVDVYLGLELGAVVSELVLADDCHEGGVERHLKGNFEYLHCETEGRPKLWFPGNLRVTVDPLQDPTSSQR